MTYRRQVIEECQVGFPIRKSMDQRVLSPPHGLSQSATSFIASYRQGIHQTPFSRLIRYSEYKTFCCKQQTVRWRHSAELPHLIITDLILVLFPWVWQSQTCLRCNRVQVSRVSMLQSNVREPARMPKQMCVLSQVCPANLLSRNHLRLDQAWAVRRSRTH